MSAINLYTTKAEALYFKDSQRNSFYEFGAIQLIPNTTYTQKSTGIDFKNPYAISVLRVADDSLVTNLSYSTQEIIGEVNTYYWSITPIKDCYNNLIYLKFTYNSTNYYSNPFYITAFDEDRMTEFKYKNLESNYYETIGLKTWFRQKSKQCELTTYYESSTKNTVTQAIKTKSLEIYESEPMSMDDLIMTTEILKSPYLYIGNTKYNLFESVKIPELTQQENFGSIKFTLAGKDEYEPESIKTVLMPDLRAWQLYNLNTATYRDGTLIPEVKTGWETLKTGAWRYYGDSEQNGEVYGRLYNWYAMMGIWQEESIPPTEQEIAERKNIAPLGWSVASEAEWLTLKTSLGSYWTTGTVLKESGSAHWIPTGGTNTTNFTALPGGAKSSNNSTTFSGIGTNGAWWSKDATTINVFLLTNRSTLLTRYYTGITKNRGSSIRLIKESSVNPNFKTVYPTTITSNSLLGTGGKIPTDFSESPTDRGIVYGTTTNPTITAPNVKIESGLGFGNYTIDITGLTPLKIYYIRAYAVFPSTGISYADQVAVATIDNKPQVSTDDVTEISTKTATCGGYVETDAGINLIERGVCWNKTGNPTTLSNRATSAFTGSDGLGAFTVDMTGLTAGDTYYVRAYARNSSATGYGLEKQFTALAVPSLNLIFNQNIANHAYSLRRLSDTFNYKCLRVRRTTTSPSATTTFANVLFNTNDKIGLDSQIVYVSGYPTGATTLGEFAASVTNGYDNVDGVNENQNIFITTWYDQSGNDKDVAQSSTTAQPRIVSLGNLELGAKFSGGQLLSLIDSSASYNNESVYVLGSATSTSTINFYSQGQANLNSRMFIGRAGGIWYNNITTTQIDFPLSQFTANTNRLYELICGASTTSAYSNGQQLSPATVPSMTVTNATIKIGGNSQPTIFSNGLINEVICLVGTPNRNEIESNINEYYSIW
jgi:uncharacterized protein (TIGR02145 family)